MIKLRAAHRLEACRGEVAIGDAVVVELEPEKSRAVFAVIDGLGHGPQAARAAEAAVLSLQAHKHESDVLKVIMAMHGALRGTRGAAATVCIVENDRLSCCGVGNVALRSHGADVPFVLSPGILGANVRRFRTVEATLRPQQRILLHSDGIASDLSLQSLSHLGPVETCESIFRTHRKRNDDGAVLVVDVGD